MMAALYSKSKNAGRLYSSEEPEGSVRYFEHDFGEYKLEARILFNLQNDWPHVLSVHGARSDYTKADALTLGLRRAGVSILGPVMSGHSEASPLPNEATSLQNNIDEIDTFFKYLDPNKPKVVIAYSLGGTPALKLLERHSASISTLILFYPGVYSHYSYNQPYGEPFKSAISKPFSYRDNDTMQLLKKFKSKVLLIKGEYDGLDPVEYGKPAGTSAGKVEINGNEYYSPIPKEVIDMILENVSPQNLEFLELESVDHSVIPWMREHPDKAQIIINKVVAYCN